MKVAGMMAGANSIDLCRPAKFIPTSAAAFTPSTSAAVAFVVTASVVTTTPSAPTDVTAVRGNGEATLSWKAGLNGGAATSYTVTSSPGGRTATTTGALSAIVTGLTNGTAYTFTVTATNAAGSVASEASTAVTPVAASPTPTTTTPTTTDPATTAPVASGVVPVGSPNTGAGGAAGSTNGLAGLGALALLLAGACSTQIVRRRRQV